MIGKIVSVKNSIICVQLTINIYQIDNLISKNVTFGERYIGEVISVASNIIEVMLIGEIVDKRFISGSIGVPSFNMNCRLTTIEEIDIIYGIEKNGNNIKIGKSYIYNNYDVYLKQIYGDYMVLPPIDEQIPRHDVVYYNFTQGQ